MTKKRFYKLLRAWCGKCGGDGKAIARVCKKQTGMKRDAEKKVSYAELWNIITINGKNADGVGVKRA